MAEQAKFGLMLLELSAQDVGQHTMLFPQRQPHKHIQAVSQGCGFVLLSLSPQEAEGEGERNREGVSTQRRPCQRSVCREHAVCVCFLS